MRFFYTKLLPTFQSKIRQLKFSWQRSVKPDHYTKFPFSLLSVAKHSVQITANYWHSGIIRTYVYTGMKFPKFTIPQLHSNTCWEHDNDDDPSQFRLKKFSLNRSRYSQMNVSKRKEWWGTCKREANILTRYRLTVLCEKEDYVSSESISVVRILVGDVSIHFRQYWGH